MWLVGRAWTPARVLPSSNSGGLLAAAGRVRSFAGAAPRSHGRHPGFPRALAGAILLDQADLLLR